MTEVSREELVERLVRATSQLNDARQTLHAIAAAEGDTSLTHMVSIWREMALREGARADAIGTRMAFAERALRRVVEHQPCAQEIAAWQQLVEDAS